MIAYTTLIGMTVGWIAVDIVRYTTDRDPVRLDNIIHIIIFCISVIVSQHITNVIIK